MSATAGIRAACVIGCLVAGLVGGAATAAETAPAELLMFEAPGCHWCEAWHEEVGEGYALSSEGHCAPLRRVNVSQLARAELRHLRVRYTPTFVLMAENEEVGRIEGYPGDDFFWPLLAGLLHRLPRSCPDGASQAQPDSG